MFELGLMMIDRLLVHCVSYSLELVGLKMNLICGFQCWLTSLNECATYCMQSWPDEEIRLRNKWR